MQDKLRESLQHELESLRARLNEAEGALQVIRQHEAEFVEAEQLAHLILEQAAEAIIVCDAEGRIIRASRQAHYLCGGNPILQLFETVFPLEDKSEFRSSENNQVDPSASGFSLAAVLHGKVIQGQEVIFTRPDGHQFHLLLNAGPLFSVTQQQLGCIITLIDITKRKQAEEALQESEARFRSIFESNMIGIGLWEGDGSISDANDALLKLLGYTRQDLEEKKIRWGNLTPPEYRHLEERAMEESLKYGMCTPYEKEYIRKQGDRIPALVGGAFFDKNPARGVFFALDVSKRKQAEEALRTLNETLEQRVAKRTAELERRNQELDQFAYVASHDLKAPLRGIDHLASWIIEDAGEELSEPSKRHLATLRSRVKRMDSLLNDLLIYSRADRLDSRVVSVDTGALINDVIELLAPPENVTIVVQKEMLAIMTSRAPLELVFRNLIDNAIKHHHRPEGWIWISAREIDGYIEFSVADDGPGIAEKFHDRIFQMFQTLQPRDRVEGSGMGLAVVKKVVEGQGCKVWVDSIEGSSSTFRFTWPKQTPLDQ